MNSLFFPRIHIKFTIFSRNNTQFTICIANSLLIHFLFANSLWIHDLFHKFTIVLLSFSRNNTQFTICIAIHFEFNIFFVNSLCFKYLFREFTFNSLSVLRINYVFRLISIYSRIHFFVRELWIFLCANLIWMHYLNREFIINPISFYQIQNEFCFCFGNSLSFFLTLNYMSTVSIAFSLWIYYSYCVFTLIDSLMIIGTMN